MRDKCAVTRAYESLGEADRETFRTAIQSPEFSGGMIALALHAHGFDIDHMAVDHYRRKLRTGKAAL